MYSHSLCARCAYQKTIQSQRGSVFWLCLKSKEDPRFPKYATQPVLRCSGFTPKDK